MNSPLTPAAAKAAEALLENLRAPCPVTPQDPTTAEGFQQTLRRYDELGQQIARKTGAMRALAIMQDMARASESLEVKRFVLEVGNRVANDEEIL